MTSPKSVHFTDFELSFFRATFIRPTRQGALRLTAECGKNICLIDRLPGHELL